MVCINCDAYDGKSNTSLSYLMTWRELRKFFLVTRKRNAQWGDFPASQNQCIISHQGKICYIGKCLTFTNWLCWKKDVIQMTLQSNFSCTTGLNISAVQESPSRHISSSLPEVKLLQKKKRKGENPTILQFDLITTSNTCSMKYFSTLFIPEQKMLKIITLLKSKSAHLLTRIKTSSSLHVSLQAHTIPFSHCCLEPVIIHGCATTEIQVLASLWKLQHLRQANTS